MIGYPFGDTERREHQIGCDESSADPPSPGVYADRIPHGGVLLVGLSSGQEVLLGGGGGGRGPPLQLTPPPGTS